MMLVCIKISLCAFIRIYEKWTESFEYNEEK